MNEKTSLVIMLLEFTSFRFERYQSLQEDGKTNFKYYKPLLPRLSTKDAIIYGSKIRNDLKLGKKIDARKAIFAFESLGATTPTKWTTTDEKLQSHNHLCISLSNHNDNNIGYEVSKCLA